MGHPRRERCARIWCVRPVVGRHRTRSARLGRPPLTTTASNGHALPPSPPPSPPPTPHSPRATSSNAVDASFAPSATETSHDATRARSSYATAASHRAAKTSVPSSRANAVNAAAATVSAFPPRVEVLHRHQREVLLRHLPPLHLRPHRVRGRRGPRHHEQPADVFVQSMHREKLPEVASMRGEVSEHRVLPVLPRRVHGHRRGLVYKALSGWS